MRTANYAIPTMPRIPMSMTCQLHIQPRIRERDRPFRRSDLADDDPPISELDAAVARISLLPPIPGRLGRDVALMARGGEGAGRGEIVAALERLRHLASMDPPQPEESE